MSDERARVLERVRQNRRAGARVREAHARTVRSPTRDSAGIFDAGSRVFDTVSGQHGEVVSATSENIIVPAPERTDR